MKTFGTEVIHSKKANVMSCIRKDNLMQLSLFIIIHFFTYQHISAEVKLLVLSHFIKHFFLSVIITE